MKVIISHDIDHLHWTDHWHDLFIPKYVVKHILFLLSGKIGFGLFSKRLGLLFRNRQHRLPELIVFNRENGVESNFFLGTNNGLGLSYSLKKAHQTIQYLKGFADEFPVGVHGISYTNQEGINQEKRRFDASGFKAEGLRMHYLRNNEDTLNYLARAGYTHDSTTYELNNPYLVEGSMLEFPVSIMDVYAVDDTDATFEKGKQKTLEVIAEAEASNLEYFTVIFHDNYFDPAYPAHYEWYKWLIRYFKKRGFNFTTFDRACKELALEKP